MPMTLHTDPLENNNPGIDAEIPCHLKAFTSEWTSVTYKQYDFGSILNQTFSGKLFCIYIFRFTVVSPVNLFLSCNQSIALQFIISGAIQASVKGYADVLLEKGYYSMLYLPEGMHPFLLEPGEHETFNIVLEPELLEDLADSREEIKQLVELLQTSSENGKRLVPMQMNYMVLDIVRGIRQCKETGGNLFMELKTAISNLLNLYRKALNDKEYVRKLPASPYKETLVNIREEVMVNPNKQTHTLAYFAKKYNLSEPTLKRVFTAFFKKPLHEFVTEECMKKAAWLAQDPELSLDDIADIIGYAERSGFIRAFKRYHGKTPKQTLGKE
jgi:AraC-like DNA-binding protein